MESSLDADIDRIAASHTNDELCIKIKDSTSGEVKQVTVKKFDHVHDAIHAAYPEGTVNYVMAGNHPVVGTDTFACAHIEAPPAPCALVSRRAPWVDVPR
jgi:hypothetical protein